MSLSNLAAIGSFVSGVAVLASLLFLYFQIRQIGAQSRQVEKNQQAVIRQNRATRTVDAIIASASDGSLAEALARCSGGASDVSIAQFAQFSNYCRASFYHYEDAFYQHREGLLNDSAFSGATANMRGLLSNVGWRACWAFQRHAFESEFVECVDKLVREAPAREPIDTFAQWRAEVSRIKGSSTTES
jgi:hypothetical protein